jgi:hypothetical protein
MPLVPGAFGARPLLLPCYSAPLFKAEVKVEEPRAPHLSLNLIYYIMFNDYTTIVAVELPVERECPLNRRLQRG